uniref:Si:ch211-157b11.8 n=1 Tax=Oncorhynchus kisutch TaxID=8019 RepID=A0A8C7F4V9_ONCKI
MCVCVLYVCVCTLCVCSVCVCTQCVLSVCILCVYSVFTLCVCTVCVLCVCVYSVCVCVCVCVRVHTEYTAVRAQVCVAAVPSARLHPQDCAEIYRLGIKENGIYTIQPDPRRPAECDMDTAGGGWTVFQRRRDGSVDFNRTWQEYREGFGSPQGEYWLGNAALHALTNTGQHLLRIQLEDWHQQKRQATYNTFRVAAEAQRYRLTAREYSGDAGNALSYSKRYNHDGRAFSTNDRDHDRYTSGNCAEYYGAGWWFDACLASNLNGLFYRGRYSGLTNGIYWGTWYILTDIHSGERYSFKSVEMKTRPRNF